MTSAQRLQVLAVVAAPLAFGLASPGVALGETQRGGGTAPMQIACTYHVFETGFVIGRDGGTFLLGLNTQPDCPWTVTSLAPFLTVTSDAEGTGARAIQIAVARNESNRSRAGWLYVSGYGHGLPVAQAGQPPVRAALDVNADGRSDLLWQHDADGRLAAWTMDGITQVGGVPLTPAQVTDTSWKVAGTGDLDGDGWTDLIWQHMTTGHVAAWLMTGSVVREASFLSVPEVPAGWRIGAVGDFNGDGRADLFWWNPVDPAIPLQLTAVWLMEGTTVIFATYVDVGCPVYYAEPVGSGDFDGDGNVDLVLQMRPVGAVVICFLNGLRPNGGWSYMPYSNFSDPDWKIRAVGDVNGDRWPDLVWQHDTSGALAAWIMHGITRVEGIPLSPPAVSDVRWRIVGPR